jgi:Na+/phosphate symporter
MLLAFAQLFASLGLIVYGVARLDSGVRQLPMDKLRDYLLKVFKGPFRSALFGAGSAAVLADTLPHYLVVGSLMGMRAVTLFYAIIVMVWTIPGALALYYLTAVPLRTIILFLFGVFCFLMTSNHLKKYRAVLEAFFGLVIIIFGSIHLSRSVAVIHLFPWFIYILDQAKASHLLVFTAGMVVWLSVKSVWVALLIAASAIQAEGFQTSQVAAFLGGTCTAITLYGAYVFQKITGGYKQLYALRICFFATASILLISWSSISLLFNRPDFINWIFNFGTSSRLICGNILMLSYIVSAFTLSVFRPIVAKTIDGLWPIVDVNNLARPKYIERQAVNAPEIAMNMVQNEQARFLEPLLRYLEIARERPISAEKQLEKIHEDFTSLQLAIETFLSELSEKQVSDQIVESFLNLTVRQKAYRSLENEVFQFTQLLLPIQNSPQIKSLMESMLEALDVTLMNLKDVIDAESDISKKDDTLLDILLADRTDIIENVRKSFLDKQSQFTVGEKKDILDATLHFERSLWFVEQLTKQVFDTRHSYAEHLKTKKRWMNQLSNNQEWFNQ